MARAPDADPSTLERIAVTVAGEAADLARQVLGDSVDEGQVVCLLGTNGAEWFVNRMDQRSGLDRFDALRATLLDYREGMHTNDPVHTWAP